MISDVDPSVIGMQECTKEQAEYIEAKLGADQWAYFGTHNVRIFVDLTRWQLLNWWGFDLSDSSMSIGPRHVVACHLLKIETGDTLLACATHLTPHSTPGAQKARVQQMHEIGARLPLLPDHEKTVLMGDINDISRSGGVRGAAGTYGLKALRSRLSTSEMYGEALNTFNGWKPPIARNEWLDEVFTTQAVKPYKAGVERTDPGRPLKVYATDHMGLRASVEFSGGLLP
jgi:endonuclease/exonuclease/phosphatase family metal-dependent hydrolase